jgi:hypothetical protein
MGGAAGAPESCSPTNCAGGCCAGNQCVHTPSAAQCGTLGTSCMPCAPCELCSSKGQCAIDPTSQWTIVADSAQVAMTPPGGGTWDPATGDEGGSAPDLFCEYDMPGKPINNSTAGVTATVVDVFSANWDQIITPAGTTVSASVLTAATPAWRIWVGDEDCVSPGNCTGKAGVQACSYTQAIPETALQSGQLTLNNLQSCTTLSLSFICQASAAAAGP